MTLNDRINAFSRLGELFSFYINNNADYQNLESNSNALKLYNIVHALKHKNGWFTVAQVNHSIEQWAKALEQSNLNSWVSNYNIKDTSSLTIGIVMAGNIPLVGMHDLLSILITGNKALIKTSSNDKDLMLFVTEFLMDYYNYFKEKIEFTETKLENYDAVIATGSNNTARYFEYYFKDKPSIIRKNRNSVAVLTGNETQEQLSLLGEDIFRYYGLGCRSVSKIFVPENYNFDNFFKAIFDFNYLIKEDKFTNNYDYNKAVYLMSEFKILDNGFLILKEDQSYSSPIGSLFYEYYDSKKALIEKLDKDKNLLQCVVNLPENENYVNFGHTQQPSLYDYADNIDTLEFLLKI